MATTVGTQRGVLELLDQLILLDYDAIEAYRAAVTHIKDSMDRSQLARFMADHERHVADLAALVEGMGGRAPSGPDFKQVLTKGKVLVGSVLGDRAILRAMKTNEDETNRAYERAAARSDLPQAVMEIVQKNLADERRHRAWIVERLETKPVHAPTPPR
jgi:uncharacterized protein (TIGR02284 family)